MFFIVSKIIGMVLYPLHLLILLLGFTAILARLKKNIPSSARKKKRLIPRLYYVALTLTLFFAANLVFPVLPYMAVASLEHRFPQPDLDEINPSIVVVLGGWQGSGASFTTETSPPISSAGDRLIAGLILAQQFPEAKFYFPGGLKMQHDGASESEITHAVIDGLGLNKRQFIIEGESRNTEENAVYIRAMVDRPEDAEIVLITSASHMPRSIGSFQAVGINPIPYPVDYKTSRSGIKWTLFYRNGMTLMHTALHEWIGLTAYYMTGRIPTLLPHVEE